MGDTQASEATTTVDAEVPPFHLYSDAASNVTVRREIVEAIASKARTTYVELARTAEVYARLRAAARRELRGGDELVRVSRNPELWELRWDFKKGGLYRLYFSEPVDGPRYVGLRFHEKAILPSQKDIDDAQDAEIDLAGARHTRDAARRWGHAVRGCVHCVDP